MNPANQLGVRYFGCIFGCLNRHVYLYDRVKEKISGLGHPLQSPLPLLYTRFSYLGARSRAVQGDPEVRCTAVAGFSFEIMPGHYHPRWVIDLELTRPCHLGVGCRHTEAS